MTIFSSVLIAVELLRATRYTDPGLMQRATDVLRGIATVTLSAPVVARVAGLTDPNLRSLDAIHLGTALHVAAVARQDLTAFVA